MELGEKNIMLCVYVEESHRRRRLLYSAEPGTLTIGFSNHSLPLCMHLFYAFSFIIHTHTHIGCPWYTLDALLFMINTHGAHSPVISHLTAGFNAPFSTWCRNNRRVSSFVPTDRRVKSEGEKAKDPLCSVRSTFNYIDRLIWKGLHHRGLIELETAGCSNL